uniref:Transmembrane protein n=1 Tax=Moniliophthora roreri TaxID=221103 RepID=A0A0W0FTH2_MONRR
MPNILSVQAATSPSSTGSSSFALGVDLSAQYDALYYGFVVTSILFGITIVQVWVYILSNNDPWPLRLLVAILFLGDLSTTILINNLIHDLLIVHFGDLLQFTVVPSVVVAELIVTGLIVCTMELFFASRIYMLGRVHRIVPICIVVFSVLALILTLVGAVGQFKDHSFAHFASRPIMVWYRVLRIKVRPDTT